MISADIIARMAAAKVPADIIADVAMALARAEATERVLEERRAKDRARKAYPEIPRNSEEPSEERGNVGNTPPPDKSPPDPQKLTPTTRTGETRTRGTVLPEGWRPGKLDRDTLAGQVIERRGQEWARHTLERFENHWRAKSGRDATKRDWQRAWANWVIEQDRRDGHQRPRQANDDGLGPTARAAIAVFGAPG